MTFLNAAMLVALTALAVPILIHLINRSQARVVDWGAMRFLRASLVIRSRRILLEDLLLLVLRCLLVALVVLTLARPFLPTRSAVPWPVLIPTFLGATVCLALAAVFWPSRNRRLALLGAAALLLTVALAGSAIERWLQERAWLRGAGGRDLAIVLDASLSMTVTVDGRSNFERALDDARALVRACRTADACSLILAGPVPRALVADPTHETRPLERALAQAKPMGGTLNVLAALRTAAACLQEGHNSDKRIIVLTDAQSTGWDASGQARWQFLAETMKSLPAPPRTVCRRYPLPATFRNAAVAGISASRRVVGPDREVGLDVRVENTGSGPLRPPLLELEVDGTRVAEARFAADIPAGTAETVHFAHRFAAPGPRLVTARLQLEDDLPADNTASIVLPVRQELPILILDGSGSRQRLASAAAFIEVALTPGPRRGAPTRAMPTPAMPTPATPAPAAPPATAATPEPSAAFLRPEIRTAADTGQLGELRQYGAIILSQVPMLPETLSRELADYVRAGGGLLIVPGERLSADFYRGWRARAGGGAFLPARFGERRILGGNEPLRPSPRTFTHPGLRLLGHNEPSDISAALVRAYWPLTVDERDAEVRVGGRFENGDPFLVERGVGRGTVVLLALALDPHDSNLPTLKCFVPLLHELVYHLSEPRLPRLNVRPGAEFALDLAEAETATDEPGTGLLGEYFSRKDLTGSRQVRLDPSLNFDWGRGRPQPDTPEEAFSVRWSGWVLPRYAEMYTFFATADDGVRLWVNGRPLISQWSDHYPTEHQGRVQMQAGRRARIRMEFYDNAGEAVAKLAWSSPSQGKETIPAASLYPALDAEVAVAASPDAVPGRPATGVRVTAPDGDTLPARLRATDDGVLVSFDRTDRPGVYTLELPAEIEARYATGTQPGQGVPFTVESDPGEGNLAPLTAADFRAVSRHLPIQPVDRSDELLAAVTGGLPGTEAWPSLALAALAVAVCETLATRWITGRRRRLSSEPVHFAGEIGTPDLVRQHLRNLVTQPAAPDRPGVPS